MTKPANIESIEKTTKILWDDWLKFFKAIDAKDLAHREIADKVYEKLKDSLENAGWWSQTLTVAYEQHIGRRKPGQRSDGTYEAAVTKTIGNTMDDAMQLWLNFADEGQNFNGVKFDGEPSKTKTSINRHWAVNLADGTRVSADANVRSSGKAMISITHSKLKNAGDKDQWHSYWKNIIEKL